MIAAVCFALGAAASNATGSVLQRRAARLAPAEETMRLALLLDLARRPTWLAGIGALIVGFLFQAVALHAGDLALVQPIVVLELPLTLAGAALVFRPRIDRDVVIGAVAVSGGVPLVVTATAPHGGHPPVGSLSWPLACTVSVAVGVALVLAGLRVDGGRRAALFGAAAGLGFGFTAALMKGALDHLPDGIAAVLVSWQLYGMIIAGVTSVFLSQNALQAGSLVAAQPPITTCDPLTGTLYGVLVFDEHLRTGLWLVPTLLGGALIVTGSVLLSRSPLATAGSSEPGRAGSPAGPPQIP